MGAWILLLLAPFAFASDLARSREWRNLLHYRPSLLGPKSAADGPDFFLSPAGKIDPEAELAATLAAFRAGAGASPVGPLRQPPLCAFPARRRFLEENLREKFPELPCEELTDWKRGLGAERAVYVFSSAYPNNPAAMFGHTLLRLDRAGAEGRETLLSYGVAFSANIPAGIDDFRYGLYGLLGGFEGHFSLAPYYTMVNDYTSSEIRDLWEYPLRLSPAQVGVLVDHLWELYSTTFFDYYFFTENCTTQLLALLQVAVDQDLLGGLPWYVLPIDSIHRLKELGLIGEPAHRPSIKKKLAAAYAALAQDERRDFSGLVSGKRPAAGEDNPSVLDAAAAYWNYKKFLNKNLKDSPEQNELRRVLLRRAALGRGNPRPAEYSRRERPDLGHHSSAAGLGHRYAEGENRVRLSYRLGMHDLLDGEIGFEASSQIDFLAGSLAYLPARKKLRLEELRFFEVTSLFPWDAYDKKLSWKLSGRLEETRKARCDTCRRGLVEGGGGVSLRLFGEKDLWYSLLLARSAYSSRTRWDLGFGSESGLLFRFTPKHSARLAARGEWDFFRAFNRSWFWEYSYTQAYTFNQRWEVRGSFEWIPRPGRNEESGGLRGIYFF